MHYKYNTPFWFLFALIIFSILAPVIDKLLREKWLAVVVIVFMAIGSQFGIGLPTSLFYTQSCIVYYLVGGFVGKFYFEKFSKISVDNKRIVASTGILFLYITVRVLNFFSNEKSEIIVEEILLVAAAVSLWELFNFICSRIETYEFMAHSFWVYALHINVGAVVTKILWFILPNSFEFSILNFCLTMIITLFLIEKMCIVTRKLCKPLYSLLSGNRG